MGAPDDAGPGPLVRNHLRPGVELGLAVLDGHVHPALLHQPEGLGRKVPVQVLQQLEPLFRVAEPGAQGGGVLQPYLGEAGNAHAHAVFVHTGADLQPDGDDPASCGVAGSGGGQGHADWLGAAQGGNHLLVQQGQQLFFGHHGKAPLYNYNSIVWNAVVSIVP